MSLRTRMFQAWQRFILRQNKVVLLSIILKWQQYIFGNELEKLRQQSSRYADLKSRIYDYLKKCQLYRLPIAVRMCLLRRKRLSQHREHTEESNAEDDETSYDQASSAESKFCGKQCRGTFSRKLLICDIDRLPPIAHCSELQKSAVSDVPGTENTASESTASAISVCSNHFSVADKLSILQSSRFFFNTGQNPITVAMIVVTIIQI
jgi:hypothetical protein